MRVLLLLFLSGFLLFLCLLWLLWPTLPKLCWIVVVVRVGTLVLFLTLGEMLSIFHHWGWCLLWVYHIWLLLSWGVFLLCLLSGGFLIINGCLILSKAFSASIEIIIWFLFFSLLMYITLIDLWIFKNHCIPGIKPTQWSWCMIFLICCWILFARILLRIFASMFIHDIGL